ncbi:hypothetical protein SNEBB_008773 [Seison nebaliae]|nr:hypothetical protein SNEBB_008773 [Seison nebaliae]
MKSFKIIFDSFNLIKKRPYYLFQYRSVTDDHLKNVFPKIDYKKKTTANNFITTVRAYNEYLIVPEDLKKLKSYQSRSPFNTVFGNAKRMTVYLRKDVEEIALKKWGSMLDLEKERIRRAYVLMERRDLESSVKDYYKNIHSEINVNAVAPNKNRMINTKSGKVVIAAFAINAGNSIMKAIAWLATGSSVLFAEMIHSLADTLNQLILAFGLWQSIRNPNPEHPYGYSNMTYISSLISGVGIFCFGCGLSVYHGMHGLFHPYEIEPAMWTFFLLGGSFVSETVTLLMAIKAIRTDAKEEKISFWKYVIQGYQPSVNVILLEDLVAILGVGVAGISMGISVMTQSSTADSIGSLIVGGLLGSVASFIIYSNANALVGKSIHQEKAVEIRNELEQDVMIRAVHDLKATEMGGEAIKLKAEIDLDGRQITRSYLEKKNIDELLLEIKKIETTQELDIFMLKHGEMVIDRVGAEIDRIERNLKGKYPEIKHSDLEVL